MTASRKELLFQIVLHLVVFIFYAFDQRAPQLQAYHGPFFLNYALAALFINYVLLPRFYYHKRYLAFACYTILIIGLSMFVEERILEPIYFPGQRAENFPGVFRTLVQIMPVITILVGFKFAWDALGKQRQLENLQAAIQESELQFLKSQINPHFLFNNLNNLYAYAIEQSDKTPTIILELSSVLRYMLYDCQAAFVPLAKELEQLTNFTRLSELQIEERGVVDLNIGDIPGGYQIAPLILIVFIENAFKHSQSSQSDKIRIHIRVQTTADGQLDFRCENSFDPTSNTEQLDRGIGLANVRKRLALLYPEQHRLDIEQTNERFRVHLRLKLQEIS